MSLFLFLKEQLTKPININKILIGFDFVTHFQTRLEVPSRTTTSTSSSSSLSSRSVPGKKAALDDKAAADSLVNQNTDDDQRRKNPLRRHLAPDPPARRARPLPPPRTRRPPLQVPQGGHVLSTGPGRLGLVARASVFGIMCILHRGNAMLCRLRHLCLFCK